MGAENLAGIADTIDRHGIDAEWQPNGELNFATAPWQLADLAELTETINAHGGQHRMLDAEQARARARVNSPTYLGAMEDPDGVALVHPAKLAWGLRQVCLDLGVRIHENTPVTALESDSAGVALRTEYGTVRAGKVVLASNVFTGLLRRLGHFIVPVYDYALVTEPLSAAQLDAIGWQGREGLADAANQFHYYRLTADKRILWGGHDAIYHYGSRVLAEYDQRPATYRLLAEQFFVTFPQLEGLSFSHRWGGAIDTCSRFTAFWGTAFAGKLAYVAGYTGLGVGATRFGARVCLDLVDGLDTERTGWRWCAANRCRSRPSRSGRRRST